MQRKAAPPAPEAALPIADVMRSSTALGRLSDRMRQSNEVLAALGPLLPAGLAAQVRAGPIDDAGWSALCANAGVAAKLRQLVPRLEQHLRDHGLAIASIRVKVQPR